MTRFKLCMSKLEQPPKPEQPEQPENKEEGHQQKTNVGVESKRRSKAARVAIKFKNAATA
jgi:hypothetical protein